MVLSLSSLAALRAASMALWRSSAAERGGSCEAWAVGVEGDGGSWAVWLLVSMAGSSLSSSASPEEPCSPYMPPLPNKGDRGTVLEDVGPRRLPGSSCWAVLSGSCVDPGGGGGGVLSGVWYAKPVVRTNAP